MFVLLTLFSCPTLSQIPSIKPGVQSISDGSQISQQMEDELTHCLCRKQFNAVKIEDGKYKFGDKDKIWHVRLMNGAVFVRFGSGWMPFDEFLESNDPCRAKARMSSSQARSGLNSRLSGSTSNLSTLKSSPLQLNNNTSNLITTKNSMLAKSWANLTSSSLSSPVGSDAPSPGLMPSSRSTLYSLSVHSPTSVSPKRNVPSSITPRSPQKSYATSTPTSPCSSSGSFPKRTQPKTAVTSPAGSTNDSSFTTSTWPRSPNKPIKSSSATRSVQPASPRSPKNTLSSSTASSRSSGVGVTTPTDSTSRARTPSGSKSTGVRSASPDPKKLTSSTGNNLFSLRQTMNF